MARYGIALILLVIIGLVISISPGITSALDNDEPGSRQDPLVTKSFVIRYVSDFVSDHLQNYPVVTEWQIKTLEPGQAFIGTSGTDFIVRTGKSLIIDPTGTGIPDLTTGTNGFHGTVAEKNHLYTLPRSDGRGVQAVDKTIVMFRGAEMEI